VHGLTFVGNSIAKICRIFKIEIQICVVAFYKSVSRKNNPDVKFLLRVESSPSHAACLHPVSILRRIPVIKTTRAGKGEQVHCSR
jgi:hypothetical protein